MEGTDALELLARELAVDFEDVAAHGPAIQERVQVTEAELGRAGLLLDG